MLVVLWCAHIMPSILPVSQAFFSGGIAAWAPHPVSPGPNRRYGASIINCRNGSVAHVTVSCRLLLQTCARSSSCSASFRSTEPKTCIRCSARRRSGRACSSGSSTCRCSARSRSVNSKPKHIVGKENTMLDTQPWDLKRHETSSHINPKLPKPSTLSILVMDGRG